MKESYEKRLPAKTVGIGSAVLAIVFCLIVSLLLLDIRFVRDYFGVAVEGDSMKETLHSGDFLYADRTAVPERGDIVIINVAPYLGKSPFSGENIIKRIIALEGDTVRFGGGRVLVRRAGEETFTPLIEDYATGGTYSGVEEFTVGEGEIFFLGDNRENSTDSRAAGCLKLSDVEGVVPEWAIKYKSVIAAWERFRAFFGFINTEKPA